jgi:uncharacterized membrane protein YcgQ (UPF0703/DUF1980 family)
MDKLASLIIETYGPFAFGCVVLYFVYKFIIQPIMASQEAQNRAHESSAKSITVAAETLKETSEINREVTQELRAVVRDLIELNSKQR